jgi:hypothetical protein
MQCINTIVEDVFCAFYSLRHTYLFWALSCLLSANFLSDILKQVKGYCREPWQNMEMTTYLGAIAARNTPILLSQLASFHYRWEAILLNILFTEVSFGPPTTVILAIAGPLWQTMYCFVAQLLISNHACLSVGLYLLHAYLVLMMLSRPYVKYRPKRERGMLPYLRWGRNTISRIKERGAATWARAK